MSSAPVSSALADVLGVEIVRLGVLAEPDPHDPFEAEGILNPGSAWGTDGVLRLFPRLVGERNYSRIGRARVVIERGVPVGLEREGVAIAPDQAWERGTQHGGVEDPRTTWIPSLGVHVMAYVAFGPFGPKPALAISQDGITWTRLGPIQFGYEAAWGTDFNLYPNKDVVFFPEVVPDPDGRPSYAFLHRPMWDLSFANPREIAPLPVGVTDARPGVWISYVPIADVAGDPSALARPRTHRPVALPEHDWERIKIGAGPAPLRTDDGWLVVHHGVSGRTVGGTFDLQQHVRYSAGALLLDADDPSRIVARSAQPLLEPASDAERHGTVANVVFPTALERVDDTFYLFYGMADSRIGVARLGLDRPRHEATNA